jgi:hypothetical protein
LVCFISDLVKTFRTAVGSASEFAATKAIVPGVGLSFSVPWGCRSMSQRLQDVFGDFRPTEQSIQEMRFVLENTFLDTYSMHVVHERFHSGRTNPDEILVQNHHLDPISNVVGFTSSTLSSIDKSLRSYHCDVGISTSSSVPDAVGFKRFTRPSGAGTDTLPCVIFEVKHTTDSPNESLAQAFVESTNVAIQLFRNGVPSDEIRVPLISSNGQLMKFGVCRMLKPSFPFLEVLSKTLDLHDETDRFQAAYALEVIRRWCSDVPVFPRCQVIDDPKIQLSLHRYFFKNLRHFFRVHTFSIDLSLFHMFSRLSRLHSPSASHEYVALPITILTPSSADPQSDTDDFRQPHIVFDNLVLDGFRIGMPESEVDCNSLLEEIRRVVSTIHESGVVHLDLYPSNIMWRCVLGKFQVKIVDWDTIHFVNEPLGEGIISRLKLPNSNPRLMLMNVLQPSTAILGFDDVMIQTLDFHRHSPALKTSIKHDLDAAFWNLMKAQADQINLESTIQLEPCAEASSDVALAGTNKNLKRTSSEADI